MVPYQTTHNTGGAIMGDRPEVERPEPLSAELGRAQPVRHGRHRLPQNAGYNPTGTVAALAYHAADAIKSQYLKAVGQPMVQA